MALLSSQDRESFPQRDHRPSAGGSLSHMLGTMVVAVRASAAEGLDELRTAWVEEYRGRYAVADLWARGRRGVSHSMETQERVFRMAEQLTRRGVERADVFTALEEADRCAAPSPDPGVAADAGQRAISTLVPLVKDSVVICADEELANLRALGIDPLSFDGYDPAAQAWVMFELSLRAEADRRARRRRGGREAGSILATIGLAQL